MVTPKHQSTRRRKLDSVIDVDDLSPMNLQLPREKSRKGKREISQRDLTQKIFDMADHFERENMATKGNTEILSILKEINESVKNLTQSLQTLQQNNTMGMMMQTSMMNMMQHVNNMHNTKNSDETK